MPRKSKLSPKELQEKKETYYKTIAASLAGVVRMSLDDDFRSKCYAMMKVSNTNALEIAIRNKLDEMSGFLPSDSGSRATITPKSTVKKIKLDRDADNENGKETEQVITIDYEEHSTLPGTSSESSNYGFAQNLNENIELNGDTDTDFMTSQHYEELKSELTQEVLPKEIESFTEERLPSDFKRHKGDIDEDILEEDGYWLNDDSHKTMINSFSRSLGLRDERETEISQEDTEW